MIGLTFQPDMQTVDDIQVISKLFITFENLFELIAKIRYFNKIIFYHSGKSKNSPNLYKKDVISSSGNTYHIYSNLLFSIIIYPFYLCNLDFCCLNKTCKSGTCEYIDVITHTISEFK